MEKHSAITTSTESGFALVEVLTMLAILSVIATVAFFIFVAGDVGTNPESENPHSERGNFRSFEPPFQVWSDSPRIPH